jgi:hypothetical protein
MTTQPLTPAIITAAHQALSQALAGPTPTGAPLRPIPTRTQPTITDVQPPKAKAGTTVTITGTDLGGTLNVFVGNKKATNVVATATQVTFDPAGLPQGPAKIVVMTNLGGVLSPKDFEVE